MTSNKNSNRFVLRRPKNTSQFGPFTNYIVKPGWPYDHGTLSGPNLREHLAKLAAGPILAGRGCDVIVIAS